MEDVKELHEKKDETLSEAKEAHNTLLEAAAEGEEAIIKETDTATIGATEFTVKTSLNGETMRMVDSIYDGEMKPGKMLDTFIDILTEQTEEIKAEHGDERVVSDNPSEIQLFFRQFIDEHDAMAAAQLCFERLVETPCDLEQERKQQAMESFPAAQNSDWVRQSRNGGPQTQRVP